MRGSYSNSSNSFAKSRPQGQVLGDRSARMSSDTMQLNRTRLTTNSRHGNTTRMNSTISTGDKFESVDDSNTEMADAQPTFKEPGEEEGTPDWNILRRVPNLFRLLDLVDERGSGGIVEKMVIDQTSLHHLLNTVQPGSYDSVSKINFKSLDELSIQATGLYGIRSEIVKYLKNARYLSDDAATFLSGGGDSTVTSPPELRPGLYLVLRPDGGLQGISSKQAYIVYWPEESTWDDRAASSSVRRNRVTFMRYLTKLTEQIVALVSPNQANNFIWDTGARNKDLPADQMEADDESRLFSFEVSKSLEQGEDAIGHVGFTVQVEPRHLPKNIGSNDIRFVPGEQRTGLLVSVNEPSQAITRPFHNEVITQMNLENTIKSDMPQIQLGNLKHDDLMHLAKLGLRKKFPIPFQNFERCIRDDKAACSESERLDIMMINESMKIDTPAVWREIQHIIRRLYDGLYPSLHVTMDMSHAAESSASLYARFLGLSEVENHIKQKEKLQRVGDTQFKALKTKWLLIRDFLTADPVPTESQQTEFVNNILRGAQEASGSKVAEEKSAGNTATWLLSFVFSESSSQVTKPRLSGASKSLSDPAFVALLRPLQESFPVLEEITKQIYNSLQSNLLALEGRLLQNSFDKVISDERQCRLVTANQARSISSQEKKDEAFRTLIHELKSAMATNAPHTIRVESLEKATRSFAAQYRWSGTHVIARGPQTRHSIYPLDLTEQDSHLCRTNEEHVPTPKLETRHKFEFTLTNNRNIELLQLVRDKCLAVISEHGRSHIYIEDSLGLDQSINRKPGKITLNHDSLGGPRCLFAFDQATRLLAIIHGEKELKLSVYVFDEMFTGLRSRGSAIPLKGWYDAGVRIDNVSFVSGTEEVCLVENSGRARIFSLITQQFRPASLQINSSIIDAIPAPDGSCLFVVVRDQEAKRPCDKLLAFHWASFGSKQTGIHVADLSPSNTIRVATRLEGRGRNYVLTFSPETWSVASVAVQVKQKATEFSFRSNHDSIQTATAETSNNSLIDCHLEVWTRFPVVPAVSRCTLSPVHRRPRKLIFQSSTPLAELAGYFLRMISGFERSVQKPMNDALSSISVSVSSNGAASLNNGISEFLFGSFIVELLCLIPLHLAITRDNRFIPLKDGVWDPAYEKSLLGADVPAIIDTLSLGWYESLFQSYMATKPVRVVSSMGKLRV